MGVGEILLALMLATIVTVPLWGDNPNEMHTWK